MTKKVLVSGKISKRNGKIITSTARSTAYGSPLIPWGNSLKNLDLGLDNPGPMA